MLVTAGAGRTAVAVGASVVVGATVGVAVDVAVAVAGIAAVAVATGGLVGGGFVGSGCCEHARTRTHADNPAAMAILRMLSLTVAGQLASRRSRRCHRRMML